jgi:hypothetical protein
VIIERRVAYSLPQGSRDYLEIRGENVRSLLVGRVVAVSIGASRTYYIVEGHDFTAEPEGRTRYHALYLDTVQDNRAKAETILLDHLRANSPTPVSFWREQR